MQENSSTTAKFIQAETAFTTAGTYVASQTDTRGKTVTTVTDADRGTTTSVTDPTGQTVNYTYDTLRRPTETATMLNGQGVSSQSAYDSTTGYLTSVTHNTDTTAANNVTYNFAYDTLGRQISVSVGSNVLSTTYYNALLRMVDHIAFGNGGAVQYLYDTFSRVIGIRYDGAASNRFSYGYDAQGRPAYVVDHTRGVTVYTDYDLAGRPCQKTHLAGAVHQYTGTLTYNGYDLPHQFTEFVGAARTRYVTGFGYDIENRVTALTYGTGSMAYTYDQLGRITQRTVKPASTNIPTTYTYVPGGHGTNSTTGLVQTIVQGGVTLTYAYDNRGNITSVSDGTKTTSYGYDAIGQLIRVNDQTDTTAGSTGTTWVFTYDLGGNIQTKSAYPYTTGTVGTATESHTFTYGNSAWRDQLTQLQTQIGTDPATTQSISYDDIGNPTSDGVWTYEWQHGRQLKRMYNATDNILFEYNENGLRTKKTVTTGNSSVVTEYVLHGKNVVHLTRGTDELHFYYDAQGKPAIVLFNGTAYGYLYNLQGDVVALVDGTGAEVVEYSYDAWGKPTGKTGSLAGTLGTVQPFRYRGYVFDEETGDYYCRSRQYRPGWGRFISPDALVAGNLYCYCDNEPVKRLDPTGMSWIEDVAYGIMDAIEWLFPGSKRRANKVLSGTADWFDYADWITLGYASAVKGAFAPEKPLSYQHWMDSLTTIAVPFSFAQAAASKPALTISWPTSPVTPLENPQYTQKVLRQMGSDAFHGFPRLIDTLVDYSDLIPITGGDGKSYTMIRLPGSICVGDKVFEGFFEYIISPNGVINHRFFNQN